MKCQILFSGNSKNIFQNVVCLNFYPGYVNGHCRFDWILQDELDLCDSNVLEGSSFYNCAVLLFFTI